MVDYLNTHTEEKKGEEKEETDKLFLEEECNEDVKREYPSPYRTILKCSHR